MGFPTFVAWKKTGKIRLCVDLRKTNQAIVIDGYPLPHLEEMFHRLTGMIVFSKLDLSSVYHQMELAEVSRDFTAFITHDGLYRYKGVCFDLAGAAAAFQKILSAVLKGRQGPVYYLDDILVAGISQKDPNENLKGVLENMAKSGSVKVYIFGHGLWTPWTSIIQSRYQTAEGTLDVISKVPFPTGPKSLQSLLGSAS